jgi:hypothetical protein
VIPASITLVLFAVVLAYGIGRSDSATRPKMTTSSDQSVSTVAASTPRCSLAHLRLVSDRGGWRANYAAAGQFRETFTFTNVSRSACWLSGWPRVRAVVDGVVEPAPMTLVRQTAPMSRPSLLSPQKTASFDIYGGDWDVVQNKACPQTMTGLQVSPPEDSKSVVVNVEEPDCGGFFVSPVISGSNDHLSWSSAAQ